MPVTVSIIVPALNEAAGIKACVQRAWATNPAEVIVVDGGSRDATAEIAAQAGACVLAAPRGRALQMNLGASHARGDVLLFLHADTWLAADGLTQIESALADARQSCGAFRQRIEAEPRIYRWIERGNAWRVRFRGLPYGDQGIFVRQACFAELGGYPPVKLLEDVLFMRRIRRRWWPLLLPGPLHVSARRWQKKGVVRQTARNWLILAAARLGVAPDRLASFYAPEPPVAEPPHDH